MRSWIALSALALGGCMAETFSPPSTYRVEVVSGVIDSVAAPGQQFGPLILRVIDDRGSAVAGHDLSASVWEGGGEATLATKVSGPDGLFVLTWKVGHSVGGQRVAITPRGGDPLILSSATSGFDATQLAVGQAMACAIDRDAHAWCWGDGWRDGIGRGDSGIDVKPDWRPIPVTGGHRFKAIASGNDAACALDLDGAAWCWGADDNGQLGQGAQVTGRCFTTLPCVRYPLPVAGGHTFERIVSAGPTTCAIDPAGAIWCWGENERGEGGGGDGSPAILWAPTLALTSDSAVQLVAGDDTFCARYATGIVECWGRNTWGEVGNPVGGTVRTPVQPQTAELFTRLFAAADGFCGRRTDGATWCWGRIMTATGIPLRQASLDPYPVISGDWMWNTYLLDQRGHLHAVWYGNVVPQEVGGTVRLNSLSSGTESGCGQGANGQLWCWGANSEGELGNSIQFEWHDAYTYPPVPVGGWYPLP